MKLKKLIIKIILGVGLLGVVNTTTIGDLYDGGDTIVYAQEGVIIDPQGYLAPEQVQTINNLYNETYNNHGVQVITYVDATAGDDKLGVQQTAADLFNQWNPQSMVLLVINPVSGVAHIAISADIKESLSDTGVFESNLQAQVQGGNIGMAVVDFFNLYPFTRAEQRQGGEEQNQESNVEYDASNTGQVDDTFEVESDYTADFSLVDWIAVGIFLIIIIGGAGFGIYQLKYEKSLKDDIRKFNEVATLNPDYNRSDIWNQLLDDGDLKHSYADYKEYVAKN